MKEINTIIENTIYNQVKNIIMEESEKGNKEVYHIKCEGEPIATFDTEEEANEELPKYKKSHPDKELIIEKGVYESHGDMIDKLDSMGEELEEKENQNMENQEPMEGNLYIKAMLDAKEKGEKTFEVDGETHNVEESWKQLEEEEMVGEDEWNEEVECQECGQKDMSEEKSMCSECGAELNEEGMCSECGGSMMNEESMCSECGGELNEEGMCSECSGLMMQETKKKKIRLKESELVKLIGKMVTEAMKGEPGVSGVPGLTVTKKAQDVSKKENDTHIGDVEKKMKNYLSFDGNDNPEFPKQIGKGDKMAINNTPEQDDEVAKNFAGLQNLDYDIEPSENFKKRLKMAIEGDTLMGNAPTTEKAKIKPSNGADKGDEAKEKSGTSIPTPETAKKIEKQVKDRSEDKQKRTIYSKEKVPVDTKSAVNESSTKFSTLLNEEIEKMRKISTYNKKTQ